MKHTILIVDDEPDVVRSVRDLLRLDYRVIGATRAEEALKLMEQEEVHVVLSDQRMPSMTGVELLGKVRGQHPDAIRLLITGYADIRAVIDAINTGSVYRYITKPWDPDELQAIIKEACERYDLIVQRKQLLAELREKNQELQTLNEELRKSSALKSSFIQVASHELRTPLTILSGLTSLACRMKDLPPGAHEVLTRIEGAGQRMQHLVKQLLTMLSAERFDQLLERQPIDLNVLLDAAIEDIRPFADLRKQTLKTGIPAGLGDYELDQDKIRDALNHLLLNAVKFTPDEGTVSLSAEKDANGAIRLIVADTGIGMDERHIERLFEPFFTGYDVSRHVSGQYEFGRQGLGLGLSVVKAFVEMHGGDVAVNSTPGQGSTFTITLPPPGNASAAAPDTSVTAGAGI
jgi:signal transduction histidine kinase